MTSVAEATTAAILRAFWHRGVKAWKPWLSSEIAGRVGIDAPSVAGLLARMEREGLVDRIRLTKSKHSDCLGLWQITDAGAAKAGADFTERPKDARKAEKRDGGANSANI